MPARNVSGKPEPLRRFSRARSGSIGIVFALSIVPLMGVIGLAVDYARASGIQSRIRSIADAAALAGARRTADSYLAYSVQYDMSQSNFVARGVAEANAFIAAQQGNYPDLAGLTYTVRVERSGEQFTATVDYQLPIATRMTMMLGIGQFDTTGTATSTVGASVTSYMDFYVLLDISASMGIGATSADISKMKTLTGCAFACHEPASKPTYYDIPRANGARFRIDVLKDATGRMLDAARTASGPVGQIRAGVFGFQNNVDILSELSTNFVDLKSRVDAITLPSAPSGTRIKQSLAWLNSNRVTASGSGIDVSNPKKFVFLVTDGVEDTIFSGGVGPDSPTPRGAWNNTGAIDPASCDALKAKGATVGILYTNYIPFPMDWQYVDLIQPFAANIPNNLRSCATNGYYFEATTPAEIDGGLQKLLQKAILSTTTRLSR